VPKELEKAREEARKAKEGDEPEEEVVDAKKEGVLTAEEEAELAELMDSD